MDIKSNSIVLYDMIYRKGIAPSPFVAVTKFILLHKGLSFEKVDLTLTEVGPKISQITDDKWNKVPTVVFPNGDIIYDSPKIAKYLQEHYPEPKLEMDRPDLEVFLKKFTSHAKTYFLLLILPMWECFEGEEQEYFRKTREGMFKCKLEDFKVSDEQIEEIAIINAGLEEHLKSNKFLHGDQPNYYDYCYFSRIYWIRSVSSIIFEKLFPKKFSNTRDWIDRMFNLYDGYFKKSINDL